MKALIQWAGRAAVMAGAVLGLSQAAWGQSALIKVDKLATGFSAPRIMVISNQVVSVFSTNASTTKGRLVSRVLQNTGTNAFLYCIGTNYVTSASYHGVVAGGAAMRDGLGSILNLSKCPWPVYVVTEGGVTTIAVVELTQ